MHLSAYWHDFIEEQGNVPGRQLGNVTVTFTQPLAGMNEVTLPSNDVTIVAEGGSIHGLQFKLKDGRRVFAFQGAVAGIADAPEEEREVKQPRRTEADSLTTGGANVPSAATPQGAAEETPEAARAGQMAAGAPDEEAAHDKAEAAEDKSEAAHDKSEAAHDKSAVRRRPGR
jgi:hypothetical protein